MCMTCGNKDLIGDAAAKAESFIPTIVKANESTKNVEECVEKLAGCVFVQNVEAPHLAVITPVLWRVRNPGQREPSEGESLCEPSSDMKLREIIWGTALGNSHMI